MPFAPSKKIEFASRARLTHVEHLAPRFFRQVLDYDYLDCLVTDESDLLDFASDSRNADTLVGRMLDRLEAHYLIDARVLGSTRIVELLEFLASRGAKPD